MKSSYTDLQTETNSPFSTVPKHTKSAENWYILKSEYTGIHYSILSTSECLTICFLVSKDSVLFIRHLSILSEYLCTLFFFYTKNDNLKAEIMSFASCYHHPLPSPHTELCFIISIQ